MKRNLQRLPEPSPELSLAEFDFHLPAELIACHPAKPRDCARLLQVNPSRAEPFSDHRVSDLPDLLREGDCLVFNDTRVIPARLLATRIRPDATKIACEFLLLRRIDSACWEAFARPGKRLRIGDRVVFSEGAGLRAEILAKGEGGRVLLGFDREGVMLDAAITASGSVPLPPYLREARRRAGSAETFASDAADYQTLFARNSGAVAAPTASLHFTPELMEALARRGIVHAFITLHVGAGTFLPVKAETIDAHRMHAEWGEVTEITAERLNALRKRGGRIVAVGTTVARLLESTCDPHRTITPFAGETGIFLRPGARFAAIDALMTNFHLPKSTLLMLVAAFSGLGVMREAYAHAIRTGYRFYSYGDSSLLFPARGAV